jgi:hypothetical protein
MDSDNPPENGRAGRNPLRSIQLFGPLTVTSRSASEALLTNLNWPDILPNSLLTGFSPDIMLAVLLTHAGAAIPGHRRPTTFRHR